MSTSTAALLGAFNVGDVIVSIGARRVIEWDYKHVVHELVNTNGGGDFDLGVSSASDVDSVYAPAIKYATVSKDAAGRFGMAVTTSQTTHAGTVCRVAAITPGSPADVNPSVCTSDRVVAVNGYNLETYYEQERGLSLLSKVVGLIKKAESLELILEPFKVLRVCVLQDVCARLGSVRVRERGRQGR